MKREDAGFFKSSEDADFKKMLKSISANKESGMFFMLAEQSVQEVDKIRRLANELSIKLAGAVFPGLIVEGEIKLAGFIVFHYKHFPPAVLVKDLDNNLEQSVRKLESFINDNEGSSGNTLYMFMDGGLLHVATFLDALYQEVADQVHYLGSGCGSETNAAMPCVFDNDEFVKQGLVAMLLPYESDPVLEHGYRPQNKLLSVGEIDHNRITTIDWKPAFASYEEIVNEIHGQEIELKKDDLFSQSVHYPFGIQRLDGENIVRIPTMVSPDGGIYCAGEIPKNSVICMMDPVVPGSEETVNSIVERIGENKTGVMLVFYCVGRKVHLGQKASEEIGKLADKLSPSSIFGALSTGEIGNSKKGGYPLLQNACILCSIVR